MVDSMLSGNTSASLSARRTRSAMACNSCRKLKMKCANINKQRCPRCIHKNIICEYSACTNTRSTDTSPTASTPASSPLTASSPLIRQANTGDVAVAFADQGTSSAAASSVKVAQAGGFDASSRADTARGSSNVVWEGATSTSCPCDDPEGHCCVVPQTPVGELSRDMQALNREIAERYPTMPPLDYY